KEVANPDCLASEDAYHVAARLIECCLKSSPSREEWERCVTGVFFVFNEEDIVRFKNQHGNDPSLDKLCENPNFLSKQLSILRKIRNGIDIAKSLDSVILTFIRKGCFGLNKDKTLKDTVAKITRMMETLETMLKYFNYPSDVEWNIKIEKNGKL